MAKKATKKKAAPKKAKTTKKFIKNLDSMSKADVEQLYKKIVKKPLHDHKQEELIKQIREVCKKKGIIEQSTSTALAIVPKKPKVKKKEALPKVNYTFDHEFNDKEISQKADQLADACIERNRLMDEKKHINSEFTAKIDAKISEINIISGHISHGYEKVTKTCDLVKDFDKGVRIYMFEGKEVGRDKLTAKDHQIDIPLEEETE